jgi:hypothetical protein
MISTLIGIIAALGGLVMFLFSKKQNAEALNQNIEVRGKLNEINSGIANDQGQLLSEEAKRKQLEADSNKEKSKQQTIEELEAFINRNRPK